MNRIFHIFKQNKNGSLINRNPLLYHCLDEMFLIFDDGMFEIRDFRIFRLDTSNICLLLLNYDKIWQILKKTQIGFFRLNLDHLAIFSKENW